eukprot:NODE_243_length_13055_cov_0.283498.p4 type:complete len:352 gc:universal NODE_243_length_13055_cov_0.283498:287-1342(+)
MVYYGTDTSFQEVFRLRVAQSTLLRNVTMCNISLIERCSICERGIMLTFIILIYAHIFLRVSRKDSRENILQKFQLVDSLDQLKPFLNLYKSNSEFACLQNKKMNKSCLDFYIHYFGLFGSSIHFNEELAKLLRSSHMYSLEAMLFMIVKCTRDDNPLLLYRIERYISMNSKSQDSSKSREGLTLSKFENMPEWATEYSDFSEDILIFALRSNSFKIFMIYYEILNMALEVNFSSLLLELAKKNDLTYTAAAFKIISKTSIDSVKSTVVAYDNDLSSWIKLILNNEYSCRICLEAIEYKFNIIILPCGHAYHYSCITTWELTNPKPINCLVCKQEYHPFDLQIYKVEQETR